MATLRDLLNAAKRCSPAVRALVVCSILIVPGFANAMLQNRGSEWRMRLIHGQPLVARFACGANSGLDCKARYTISYSKEASQFCEHVSKDGQATEPVSRCNSDPAKGWLSIDGVLYSYNRLGVIRLDSRFVGQLMLP